MLSADFPVGFRRFARCHPVDHGLLVSDPHIVVCHEWSPNGRSG